MAVPPYPLTTSVQAQTTHWAKDREISVTLGHVPKEWDWNRTLPLLSTPETMDILNPQPTALENSSFIILVCVLPLPKEKNIINWEEQEEKDLGYISTLCACFSALLEFDIFR